MPTRTAISSNHFYRLSPFSLSLPPSRHSVLPPFCFCSLPRSFSSLAFLERYSRKCDFSAFQLRFADYLDLLEPETKYPQSVAVKSLQDFILLFTITTNHRFATRSSLPSSPSALPSSIFAITRHRYIRESRSRCLSVCTCLDKVQTRCTECKPYRRAMRVSVRSRLPLIPPLS